MARFKHTVTGVVVSVDDEKTLSAEWEPVDVEKRRGRKPADSQDK